MSISLTLHTVEHNIKDSSNARPHRRRPDMSSFTSHLHQISTDDDDDRNPERPTGTAHHHGHLGATPVDMAGLFRLLQDQMATLMATAPSDANRSFLDSLVRALEADIDAPPERIHGGELNSPPSSMHHAWLMPAGSTGSPDTHT